MSVVPSIGFDPRRVAAPAEGNGEEPAADATSCREYLPLRWMVMHCLLIP